MALTFCCRNDEINQVFYGFLRIAEIKNGLLYATFSLIAACLIPQTF